MIDSDGIEFKEVERFAEPEFSQLLTRLLLNQGLVIPETTWLSEEEVQATRQLEQSIKQAFSLRVGAYHRNVLIGWAHGFQDSAESFIMATSAVHPSYRRQGIYTQILRRVLARTKAAGFQVVYSKHVLTNNPILIAKLKMGFTIVGMELSDGQGLLVRLRYLFNERRLAVAYVRAGAQRPQASLMPLLERVSDDDV